MPETFPVARVPFVHVGPPVFQYYRQARLKALCQVFPDMFDEKTEMLCITEASRRRYNYPRPYSEPPSPSSSRLTTPGTSVHGSDDEDIDDEREVSNTPNARGVPPR